MKILTTLKYFAYRHFFMYKNLLAPNAWIFALSQARIFSLSQVLHPTVHMKVGASETHAQKKLAAINHPIRFGKQV